MRHTTRRSFHEGLAAGVVIAAFVFAGFTSAPASAGQYACPDMTGLDGLPDGHVDASDLSAFAAAKGSQSSTGDFNGDGPVDDIDQAMFEEVFGQSNFSCDKYWAQQHSRQPSCIDMTGDGSVDASDVSAFAATKGTNNVAGDFSGDSQVDNVDQAILETALGTTGHTCGIVASINPETPPPPPVERAPTEPEQGAEAPAPEPSIDPIAPIVALTPVVERISPATTTTVSTGTLPVNPAPAPMSATGKSFSVPAAYVTTSDSIASARTAPASIRSITAPAPQQTADPAPEAPRIVIETVVNEPVVTAPSAPVVLSLSDEPVATTSTSVPQAPADTSPLVPVSMVVAALGAVGLTRRSLHGA